MKPVLLVGNGPMAEAYAKVLREGLERPFAIAGRNPDNIDRFRGKHGALEAYTLSALDEKLLATFAYAIVATSRDSLQEVTEALLDRGLHAALIEKPVSRSVAAARSFQANLKQRRVVVRVALNRRYYQSVQSLRAVLRDDPPVGATFDFTELAHRISFTRVSPEAASRWAFGNSIHVFDTVRFLLGDFRDIKGLIAGEGELDWHPSGAQFVGVANCGSIPVAYASNWNGPGRWEIQIMARGGRYRLAPMERLQVLRPKTFDWAEVEADYSLDERFKPGLYRTLESFEALVTSGGPCDLPDVADNTRLLEAISTIVGYPT